MARAAILAYHPIHIVENTYAGSDLVALESDLESLRQVGIRVLPLERMLTMPGDRHLLSDEADGAVAITFDDGSVFDFVDHSHPTCGPQRSAATILAQAAGRPRASTFVIASPAARAELDRADYFGGGYWPDDWWRAAASGAVLAVESHSWDHNHPSIARSAQRDNVRGTFTNIETYAEAEAEIAQAQRYIAATAGAAPKFFAYPWGEANEFLTGEYLPRRGVELGLRAAVSSAPLCSGFVTGDSDRWLVPRFVCGHDWKSPAELEALLAPLAR